MYVKNPRSFRKIASSIPSLSGSVGVGKVSKMEPVAFVSDKIRGFTKSTQELFDSLVHGRPQPSARRHPDEVDLLGAFLLVLNSEDEVDHSSDALTRAGMRTGVDSRFVFETTVRENDTLVAEFVAGQKHKSRLSDLSECPLSLAKASYTANVSKWLSAIAIPVGAQCRDVAVLTSPTHQGKGLTDLSSFGPPLLNQDNGSAIGLMVKKKKCCCFLVSVCFSTGNATEFR